MTTIGKGADLMEVLKKKMRQAKEDTERLKDENEEISRKLHIEIQRREAAEGEVAALNRRIQLLEEDLERSEERLNTATTKLAEASQAADESERSVSSADEQEQRAQLLLSRIADIGVEVERLFALHQKQDEQEEEGAVVVVEVEQRGAL
ncbi:Tropomyosin [Halocaridina rubra]|uniref:Tropomyosin n=1 Tax=Halocaridina rubra TaxID=373956 RepID=A0AAN8X341_HALRR